MLSRTRLPFSFDPAPLRAEADALPAEAWIPHFNTSNYEGDWSGVALRSAGGRELQIVPYSANGEQFADTPTLTRCPHLRAVLDRFQCKLLSVRLLRLGPGALIREHSDPKLGYDDGEVRIHVPLSTNPEVAFMHDGTRVDMEAGEAWYMDLTLPHAVRNDGTSPRIHLLLDCVLDDWLRGVLGAGTTDGAAGADTSPEGAAGAGTAADGGDPARAGAGPGTAGPAQEGTGGPAQEDTGGPAPLGLEQLERLRRRAAAHTAAGPGEFRLTHAVLDRIGVGLEPTHQFLFATQPSSEDFERWLLEQLGGPADPDAVEDAAAIALGQVSPGRQAEQARIDAAEPSLSPEDLSFWEEHGYVILHQAAPNDARAALERAIYDHLGADPADPESWYRTPRHQGVMVQLFNAPGISEIHASLRIRKAFAQVAQTSDLIMSTDRCGFNPPVRDGNPYGGAGLHLDVESLEPPVPTHLQGILYLSDTAADQGALRLVPGFHRRIDDWLRERFPAPLPDTNDLEALDAVPVAAGAGDLIIWDARLPHGPSVNTAGRPRVVHYLRMYPRPLPVSG
jgi:hypothetical protein